MSSEIRVGQRPGSRYEDNWEGKIKLIEVFEIISNLYFLQFCFKTEGFLSHYFVEKTFSFSLKTEGNTNFSLNLKLKVFQRKPSVFLYKKLKQNRENGNKLTKLKTFWLKKYYKILVLWFIKFR